MPEKKIHWTQTPAGRKKMSGILAKARKKVKGRNAATAATPHMNTINDAYRQGYRDGFKDAKE